MKRNQPTATGTAKKKACVVKTEAVDDGEDMLTKLAKQLLTSSSVELQDVGSSTSTLPKKPSKKSVARLLSWRS